jgi:hypothetical protein
MNDVRQKLIAAAQTELPEIRNWESWRVVRVKRRITAADRRGYLLDGELVLADYKGYVYSSGARVLIPVPRDAIEFVT